MGYKIVVVLGSEMYYPKFGYKPASQFGILPPFDVPDVNFMAVNLTDGMVQYTGTLEYAKEFFEV